MKKLLWILLIISVLINAFLIYSLFTLTGLNLSLMNKYGLNFNGHLTKKDKERFENDLERSIINQQRIGELAALAIHPIDTIPARNYHKTYVAHRATYQSLLSATSIHDSLRLDDVEAVIFELDSIVKGAIKAYGISKGSFTLKDFANKSVVLYFANYGQNPEKPDIDGTPTKQKNTLILQFAERADSTKNWSLKTDQIYNFGGLKPKKKLNFEQIFPR